MQDFKEMETAIIKYVQTFEDYRKVNKLTLSQFADGWIFATILKSAYNFKIQYGQLIEKDHCIKWTHRLNNLKKIVSHIEQYFQQQIKKGIKTKDIDLIQIAKNQNPQEIIKMFELVIAVLTQAPNKEDHINSIMSLDQKSQSAFVLIIQNLLENRILDQKQSKQDKIVETITHLQMENTLLRSEVESLLKQNGLLQKQISQLKNQQVDYIEELNKIRDQQIDKTHHLHEQPKQRQHLRSMVENLKQKLISTVRENEIKIVSLRQQNHILQTKCFKFQEIQEQLQDYKKKYLQIIESHGKAKLWERQKNKLIRTLQQKDQIIKKISAKLDQAKQQNYAMQQREVYAKMELQKRDVRFKELEKQVKRKYGSNTVSESSSSKSLQLLNTNVAILSQQIGEIDKLQIQQLKNQIDQLKKKNRENERQNNKLKRNIEKMTAIENDKKKLQRLILQINNEKRQQVQLLLATTYEFFNQNQRLKILVKQKNSDFV